MIVVAGEALVDLIVEPSGTVVGVPGGGPYNVARTVARLGVDSTYLGLLSADAFGRRLRRELVDDGVRLAVPDPVELPTTLAVADLAADGSATYRFHTADTSAVALRPDDVPPGLLDGALALHVGTLGLVFEPVVGTLRALVETAPDGLLVMLDPNCRPTAVADRSAYLARLHAVLLRADVVKVSTEDLAYLEPATDPVGAARRLLDRGPTAVLVTDGPRAARVVTSGGVVDVPPVEVHVVDTVGAGDAFGGAFLAWWSAAGLNRDDVTDVGRLTAATTAAVRVAALTCARRGSDPPRLADLGGTWP